MKLKIRNFFLPVLPLLFSISCTTNDTTLKPYLTGNYKVISIQSIEPVDLNNDGIKTKDIYSEISGPHHTIDEKKISFYDFNSPFNYLKFNPNSNLVSVNYPTQAIDFLTTGQPFLVTYQHSFLLYSYESGKDTNMITLNTAGDPNYDQKGNLNSLELLESGDLKLLLTKRIFDFVEGDWVEISITAVYRKVE